MERLFTFFNISQCFEWSVAVNSAFRYTLKIVVSLYFTVTLAFVFVGSISPKDYEIRLKKYISALRHHCKLWPSRLYFPIKHLWAYPPISIVLSTLSWIIYVSILAHICCLPRLTLKCHITYKLTKQVITRFLINSCSTILNLINLSLPIYFQVFCVEW